METAKQTGSAAANPLGEEKIGKLLLRFSIPCVCALLVNALYNIVDQIFIGQGVGYLGNAATNVVYPVTAVALGCALLVCDGCAAKYSLLLGKGDRESGSRAIGNSMLAVTLIGVLLSAVGLLFTDPILALFGATENSMGYARGYLQVILLGIPFFMLSAGLNTVIRADGSPRYSMLSTLIGAAINLILAPSLSSACIGA